MLLALVFLKKLFVVVSIFYLNKKPGLSFIRTTNNTMSQTPITITNTDTLNIDLSTIEFNIPASQPVNPAPTTITRDMLEAKSLEELKEFKTANKIPGRAPVTNKVKYIDFIMAWVDAGGVPKAKPATTKKKPEPIPEPDSGDEAGPATEELVTTPARIKTQPLPALSKAELDKYTTNIISSRYAMRDKVHQIHNYLRNKGAGYGLSALKVFNLFWGIYKVEQMGLIEKLGLTDIPKFSDLCKLAYTPNNDENQRANFGELHKMVTGNHSTSILSKLSTERYRELLFYEIPRDITNDNLAGFIRIINELGKAESMGFQLAGKIYEYFIGRDATAISELGAYFTDRHITNWIYQHLCSAKPSANGTIPTMIDPFGGSGGFTTGYIQHMITRASAQNIKIPWKTEISKIYHYDINHDVLRAAALEFLCLTEKIPTTGSYGNIKYNNSFESEFYIPGSASVPLETDYVITNPPYGGDSNKTSSNKMRNDKIREHIKALLATPDLPEEKRVTYRKQLSALKMLDEQEQEEVDRHKVKYELCADKLKQYIRKHFTPEELLSKAPEVREKYLASKFNDKESCSLALLMDIVKKDGEVIGVLKEGVFFDSCYKELRRKLIELFNVTDVISIPASEFENTTTKTSILKFNNTDAKTTFVKFGELKIERFKEDVFEDVDGIIKITKCAGDIADVVYAPVTIATKDQILAQKVCSFNGKEYTNRDIIPNPGFKMVPLGELVELSKTTTHCSNIGKINGKYKFYCSSKIQTSYVDFCEHPETRIIIGQGGNFNVHIDKNFTASKHVCVINNKTNDIAELRYLYYIISLIGESCFLTNGTTIQWLNKENIKALKLPIPESQEVLTHYVTRLSTAYNTRQTKETQYKELEKQVMARIQEITVNEECETVKLGDICESKCGVKCNLQNYITDNSEYIVLRTRNLTGSNDFMYITQEGYKLCQNSIVAKNDILITAFTDSFITYKVYNKWIGHTFNGGLFRLNRIKINVDYFNYCLNQQEFIKNLVHISGSSTASQFNTTKLMELPIKLPKNKQLITDLEPTFQAIEKLKQEADEADKAYSALLEELKHAAIKSMPQ